MKKIISILMVLGMLLSFAACSDSEETAVNKTDIVGEWMSPSVNASAVFKEDGTGELSLYGTHSATWKYDAKTDRYIVTADKTYNVIVGKEYSMPYMNIDGIDFYLFDDYDNAFTLMISKRCEDIANLTADMTEINVGKSYDFGNGITIIFSNIALSETAEDDGVMIDFMMLNEGETPYNGDLSLTLNGKYYLAEEPAAISRTETFQLAQSIDSCSGVSDSFRFSLVAKVADTVERYGMVIGAVYFEMNEQNYYIDLSALK